MSREIPLSKGYVAIVDDEDYDYLSRFSWQVQPNGYAKRYVSSQMINGKQYCKYQTMHREVMKASGGQQVDHINLNKLDNRKENLRICNASQNSSNRKKKLFTTGIYKGVSWCRRKGKYKAGIKVNGKQIHLGYHTCPKDGGKAYNEAALKYKGEFAYLNVID